MKIAAEQRERFLWDGFLGDDDAQAAQDADAPPHAPQMRGQRVLITGAGGFLGASAARAMARAGVAHLCLLDLVEHGLFELQQQLDVRHPGLAYDLVLGSVGDRALLDDLLTRYRPTVVLHTAALKHVPMLEDNALAAVSTNVLGTETLCRAVAATGAQRLVLCSTDKAVEPVGVMGATKRLAEQLAFTHAAAGLPVQVLRLPNVLGSTGSVAPLFAAQIAHGTPLTVTDRAASRLWISPDGAVRCLLESLRNDLPSALSIPRTAESRPVLDLLAHMLQRADVQSPQIAFTGLRRGERLTETLFYAGEVPVANHSALLNSLAVLSPSPTVVEDLLANAQRAVGERDHMAIVELLHRVKHLGSEESA